MRLQHTCLMLAFATASALICAGDLARQLKKAAGACVNPDVVYFTPPPEDEK